MKTLVPLTAVGVVRLLTPSGGSEIVATFPMTPDQHELWYAVSPDGSRLLAGVLTLPAIVPPPPGKDLPPTLAGSWKVDLEGANAGGPTRVLQHLESPEPPANPQEFLKTIFRLAGRTRVRSPWSALRSPRRTSGTAVHCSGSGPQGRLSSRLQG